MLRTSTDEDGRFAICRLASYPLHRLTLTPAGESATVLRDVTLVTNEEADLGDIQAVVGGAIAGQLVGHAGDNLGGITVYPRPSNSKW